MKTKNFKLTEEQFVLLMSNSNVLRNRLINEMESSTVDILKDYYQKQIDLINELFDSINSTLKTNF
jgi:hypothetical protein